MPHFIQLCSNVMPLYHCNWTLAHSIQIALKFFLLKPKTISPSNIMDNHGTWYKLNCYDTYLMPYNSNVFSTILTPFFLGLFLMYIFVFITCNRTENQKKNVILCLKEADF